MCEYSLVVRNSRLAVTGEELVIHKFREGPVGMASAHEAPQADLRRKRRHRSLWSKLTAWLRPRERPLATAVCLAPGARLLVHGFQEKLRRECGFDHSWQDAVFTQAVSLENVVSDAMRFQNGKIVLLHRLNQGQRVLVLDVSSSEDDCLAEPNRGQFSEHPVPMRQGK